LPTSGKVMNTVNRPDRAGVVAIARRFHEMGFGLVTTAGTGRYLAERGVPSTRAYKVSEGRPNGIDLMVNGEIQLLINTPLGKSAQHDDYIMRAAAIANHVPYTTTLSGASAACDAILSLREHPREVRTIQEWQEMIP
ncbi:MAG: carbamoyl phosphate synthase large subunit, partial [Gemmatimonadota bacterium]|nr:carbamoyl phosphate synthase large subunit [Gemmatimonadota bacterium]